MTEEATFGPPVVVGHVIHDEREALVHLLEGLDAEAWRAPTPCPAWSVHQLAIHLLHDDLRRLSAERDAHAGAWIDASNLDELVVGLDRLNEHWVEVMAPTLSPRLTRELLAWSARPTEEHLAGLDPEALDGSVAWAGPGAHPNWLDVAREYTERWVHQQQLREAVGRPGLTDAHFAGPVVETFARGLPAALPQPGPEPQILVVRVTGPFERSWTLESGEAGWRLTAATADVPSAVVELPVETFWRRAVRMIDHEEAARAARTDGAADLVEAVLNLRAAIVRDVPVT